MYSRITLFTLLLLSTASVFAQVTYSYQGNNFNQFDPPFTANSRITGSFDVAQPLAINTTSDLVNSIQTYSFSDGQNTRDQNNSILCQFDVTTDTNGSISAWFIYIRQSDTAVTENQHSIDLFSNFNPPEQSVFDVNQGNSDCSSFAVGVAGSSSTVPANPWSGGAPQAPQSVPALSNFMLWLLVVLMAVGSYYFIKERPLPKS